MSPTESTSNSSSHGDVLRETELGQIIESLRGLKYGSVSIIVQDGVIVQIDRLEKRRLRKPQGNGDSPS